MKPPCERVTGWVEVAPGVMKDHNGKLWYNVVYFHNKRIERVKND